MCPAMKKSRADNLLVARGLCQSRSQAQTLILAGEVWCGERRVEKASDWVFETEPIVVRPRAARFVSRGGEKLEHALKVFQISVPGKVCLDIGASTGGFTDCLLKHGAERVFAVDVGYGQLDSSLRKHAKVSVLENTNARTLTFSDLEIVHPSATQITLVVIDVSFISLSKIVLPLSATVRAHDWVMLFKPQFEVGPENVVRGGVVKSEEAVESALASFHAELESAGFKRSGMPQTSPLLGKKSGNLELLVHYVLGDSNGYRRDVVLAL